MNFLLLFSILDFASRRFRYDRQFSKKIFRCFLITAAEEMVRMASIASQGIAKIWINRRDGDIGFAKSQFSPSPPLYSGQPACWLSLPLSSFVLAAVAATGTISVFLSLPPFRRVLQQTNFFFASPHVFFFFG